jgi:hypothetical protein
MSVKRVFHKKMSVDKPKLKMSVDKPDHNRNKKFPHHIGDCSPGQDIIINIYLNRPPSLYIHLRHCPELSGKSPTVGEQSHSLINMLDCHKKSLPLWKYILL